jgi:small subunit ribosomal protein S6
LAAGHAAVMDRQTGGRFSLRRYEYMYIFEPQEEVAKKSIDWVKQHYTTIGAKLLKEDEMGKRRLAYEIDKKTDGFYYVTQIEIDDLSKLTEFESELKLNGDVIRYMKVRI